MRRFSLKAKVEKIGMLTEFGKNEGFNLISGKFKFECDIKKLVNVVVWVGCTGGGVYWTIKICVQGKVTIPLVQSSNIK